METIRRARLSRRAVSGDDVVLVGWAYMWGKIIYSELTLAIAMRLPSRSLPCTRIAPAPSPLLARTFISQFSSYSAKMRKDPFKPAARVAGQKQDVWSIVNEAAATSKVSDVVNMG
jgi:hypothetical protein